MNILELDNKHIKIGKTSITVINTENNKTCGVVRNICKFKDLQANKQINYSKALRSAGLQKHKKALVKACYIPNYNNIEFTMICDL